MVFQIPTEINNTFPSCFARVEIIAKASPTGCLTSQSGGGWVGFADQGQEKQSFFRGTLARMETLTKVPAACRLRTRKGYSESTPRRASLLSPERGVECLLPWVPVKVILF
jgi:hypothetical protein